MGQRLLVVVAHPDDETFGCGSLLAHAAASGVHTMVCCATRGEAGTPAPGSGLDGAHLGQVREAELRQAAKLLGVSRVRLLTWIDSDMAGDPAPGSLVAAPLRDVASAIVEVIDEFQPHVVVTLDASDGHRDHVHVRDATLLAIEQAAWDTPRAYLHCLPRSLMRQWVDHLRATSAEAAHLDLGELGTPDALITTVIDTSSHEALRRRAMAAHRSQVPPYDAMPPDLQSAFLTVDRLRRVRPDWHDDALESDVFAP